MVALRKSTFIYASKHLLTNKRICVEKELVDSNILQSECIQGAQAVSLLLLNIGRWCKK